jgi:hypothetical protein
MPSFKCTFVTAFIDLEEGSRKGQRVPSVALEFFAKLVATGINIHAFVSQKYVDDLPKAANLFVESVPNWDSTHACEINKLQECWNSQPFTPTPNHDTPRFMSLQLSKTDFVEKAIRNDVFGLRGHETSHFAWIDFSIVHVFKNVETTLAFVEMLGHSKLVPTCLVMPGCSSFSADANFTESVCWRFCGGFFLGDRHSLLKFSKKVKQRLSTFVKTYQRLVWEVNFWAWLEANAENAFRPQWYKADHTDTIVTAIPRNIFWVEASLTTIPSRVGKLSRTLSSLSNQVDKVNLYLSTSYKRFNVRNFEFDLNCLANFRNVEVHWEQDTGPATKVLGIGDRECIWTLVVDDDQVYHPTLVSRMMERISCLGVYQNRFDIVKHGDGGIVHGYVGYLVHSSVLRDLRRFPRPDEARYVDDQWMSVYCFKTSIPIFASGVEDYSEIFAELENNHELIGSDPLISSGPDRKECIRKLGEFFNVSFLENGNIMSLSK